MAWLEASAFAEWIRTSAVGYPVAITLHSIGMSIMVGLVFVVSLRLVGFFERMPFASLERMLALAGAGFIINFLSGAAIFTSQATFYVANGPFLLKFAAVLTGALLAGYIRPILRREAGGWADSASIPGMIRGLAIVSIALWCVAITTGRFTAYL